jgi:hypothetical protein
LKKSNHEDLVVDFSDERAEEIIGKHILVGITHFGHEDEVLELDQYHGVVVLASIADGIVIREESGEIRTLPPDLSSIRTACSGSYRLKKAGEIVNNPDLMSVWSIYPPKH